MYAVGLCLLLFINACKKNDVTISPLTQNALVIAPPAARTGPGNTGTAFTGTFNAVVNISEVLFGKLMNGELIEIKPVSPGIYNAIGTMSLPDTTGDPNGPCAYWRLMAEYEAYRTANNPRFQAWANENCEPFRGGWSKCDLCIMFSVPPNFAANCPQEAPNYNQQLPLFIPL